MELREYQSRTVVAVNASHESGKHLSTCVVLPTGGGKTVVAQSLCEQRGTSLFVVHTTELLEQTAARFRASGHRVNVIAPGYYPISNASIHVGTVQSIVAREASPDVQLVVLDECHHYVPDNNWSSFLERYPRTPRVGFTATPQRSDGRPLGDMFSDLIVGAQYSELIDQGFIVPAKVFQPARGYNGLKRFALALDPIEALNKYGRGQAFGFAPSVKLAREYAARSDRYASIDGKVPKGERRRIIDSFRAGSLDVLWNYNVLTEGVDIPSAETVILGRAFSHVSAYMQAVGRVLRSSEGKEYAIVIDLGGVTHIHGFPTDDRVYSLDGDGIRKSDAMLLRNCPKCHCTLPATQMLCDECGYEFKARDPRIPQCFSLELQEAMAGTRTVESAKEAEYNELRAIQKRGRKSLRWLAKEYKKRFQCKPAFSDVTREEKHREHALMRAEAMRRGYKLGWVSHQFHALFGHYPGQI